MNVFQFYIICKRTNNANNATHYVKLGKKRRESSKRNYYIISPRVIIKAIIVIYLTSRSHGQYYYTVGALDAEAKKYVFLNPERNCILIVSSPAQQKCAQNDLVWDGGEDAEEWCCDKHDNYCQHEGCASEQVEK